MVFSGGREGFVSYGLFGRKGGISELCSFRLFLCSFLEERSSKLCSFCRFGRAGRGSDYALFVFEGGSSQLCSFCLFGREGGLSYTLFCLFGKGVGSELCSFLPFWEGGVGWAVLFRGGRVRAMRFSTFLYGVMRLLDFRWGYVLFFFSGGSVGGVGCVGRYKLCTFQLFWRANVCVGGGVHELCSFRLF